MNKQKGITSIAVMIIMLVLAIALPVTTKLVQQNQENRSKATDVATCINPNEYRWAYSGGVCKRVLARYCIGCQVTTGGQLTCYAGTDLGETTCKKDNIKDCTTTGCSSGYSCQRQDNMWQCLKTTTTKYTRGSCQSNGTYSCTTSSSGTYTSLSSCQGSCTYANVCNSGETRWMYNGSSCVQGPVKSCESCSGSYPCYGTKEGCTGAHPAVTPTVSANCSGTRYYWNGSSCLSGDAKRYCSPCGGNYSCYNTLGGCTGAHPPTTTTKYTRGSCQSSGTYSCTTSSSGTYTSLSSCQGSCTYANVCNSGETRWMYNGSSCVQGPVKSCESCSGSYPCYGTKEGCTGAHPNTTTYTCSDKACSANYGCMRNGVYTSSTSDCSMPIGTVSRTYDASCPKRNGAGGGNDDACTTAVVTPEVTPEITPEVTPEVTATPTIAAGEAAVNIKLAFAGVKLNNGQCATNWPVTLKMVDSTGKSVVDQIFSGVPTQTASINSKGEIIYDFNVTVSNVPEAGGSDLAFFLAGPKHISLKYGKNNQSVWYSNLVGTLGLIRGSTNSYDFSGYSLLAGDVTGEKDGTPDGKIDGRDFSYIKEKANVLASGGAGTSGSGDLDGNCQVNSGDVRLIKQSLTEINGQTY